MTTNWNSVAARVNAAAARAGRDPDSVRIVTVTKTLGTDRMAEAYSDGARIFGESYVQEALPKIDSLRLEGVQWHFIGALQSNKARQVVGVFDLIHSLDRWSLAKELEKASQKTGRPVNALVELNVAGEKTKSGVSPDELLEFVRKISTETNIAVRGLMVFPPLTEDSAASRPYFKEAREWSRRIRELDLPRISMSELSMGVTSDFETAVEEGATLVRIGMAIFGERK